MRERKSTCQERLAQLIKEFQLTQKELAEKAGIRESSLSNYVQGKSNPNMEIICKLSEALDVSTDWLLGYGEKQVDQRNVWEAKLLEKYYKTDKLTQDIIHEILDIHPSSSTSEIKHTYTDTEIMNKLENVDKVPARKENMTDSEKHLIKLIRDNIYSDSESPSSVILETYIQTVGPISEVAQKEIDKLMKMITKKDFEVLLHSASKEQRLILLLAGVCGLRAPEICALKYDDFDFKAKKVHVHRQVVRTINIRGFVRFEYSEYMHDRYVSITDEILELIGTEETFSSVFTGKTPSSLVQSFQRLCKRLNMKYSYHALRPYAVRHSDELYHEFVLHYEPEDKE